MLSHRHQRRPGQPAARRAFVPHEHSVEGSFVDATDRRHRTAKRTNPTGRIALLGLIAVAGACVFGSVSLAAGATAPPKVEGERLSVAKPSGQVAREAGRSGGRVLVLTGASGARGTIRTSGPARLNVFVRVAGCRGLPRLTVALNRTVVISKIVRRSGWHLVSSPKRARAGTYTLTTRLANQTGGNCRRALRIDRLFFSKPAATPPVAPPAAAWWRPAQNTTWQWQLSGSLNQSVAAQMYDIDLFDRSAGDVASLHAKGRKVICYFSGGSYEGGRPDSSSFPQAVLGSVLDGWPNEKWLDIRRIDLLRPIMKKRLDLCRQKGFDGVEADNVDGYSQQQRVPAEGRGPACLQPVPRDRGPRPGAVDRAQERPRAGRRPRTVLRLRGQRAVLPVQRVRPAQPVPQRRQGRLQRRVRRVHELVLP